MTVIYCNTQCKFSKDNKCTLDSITIEYTITEGVIDMAYCNLFEIDV